VSEDHGGEPWEDDTWRWRLRADEFANCNCAYGCPCQFNALPTHGFCQAVAGMEIEHGYHGETKLDGLRFAGVFRWPGPIHEGKGEAAVVIDREAVEDAFLFACEHHADKCKTSSAHLLALPACRPHQQMPGRQAREDRLYRWQR